MGILGALSEYISFYPLVALVCLLMAGLNLPMSEDLVIITGAILSSANPDILIPTLIAIYIGAIGTDFLSYYIGTRIRKGVSKSRVITRVLTRKRFDRLHHYLDKYGIFTFIVCRFIPFGVRNALCIATGMANLRLRVFAIYDVTAAMISINTLFFFVYFLGDTIAKHFKVVGIILFILLVCTLSIIIVRLFLRWRKWYIAAHCKDTLGC